MGFFEVCCTGDMVWNYNDGDNGVKGLRLCLRVEAVELYESLKLTFDSS